MVRHCTWRQLLDCEELGLVFPNMSRTEAIGRAVEVLRESFHQADIALCSVLLGVICGLAFGIVDVRIMLPMSFPDKRAAITAAFIARFASGFVIGSARLPWPGWAVGLFFGLLLSIPDAIWHSIAILKGCGVCIANEPFELSHRETGVISRTLDVVRIRC